MTLFLAFRDGDAGAFDALYDQLYPRLLRFGLTIYPNREEVRDQLQDLFVWMYENPERLSKTQDPEIYLLAAIRNRLRKYRKRNRLQLGNKMEDLVVPVPDFSAALFASEEERQRHAVLAQQLLKLPARQQQVIYLRFYEEKEYEEIAQIMDTPVQVVRNFVYRGLQKLRASSKEIERIIYLLLLSEQCSNNFI